MSAFTVSPLVTELRTPHVFNHNYLWLMRTLYEDIGCCEYWEVREEAYKLRMAELGFNVHGSWGSEGISDLSIHLEGKKPYEFDLGYGYGYRTSRNNFFVGNMNDNSDDDYLDDE